MCIHEFQQMKIFDFSQSRNDFFQTVPYWLPEYLVCIKKLPFLSHLQAKYVRPLLTNTLLYSMIWYLLYRFNGVLLVTLVSNIFQNKYFSSLLTNE